MLRKNLLLTTAFVVAAAASTPVASSTALARPAVTAPGRNSNHDFLRTYACNHGYFSTYGWTDECCSSVVYSHWQHVAAPTFGTGKTVDRIVVEASLKPGVSNSTFSAGIYANSPSGYPGKLIAKGNARAPSECGKVTISIPPTMLSRGKKYWIEETTSKSNASLSSHGVYWWRAPSKHKAYVQTHKWT